MISTAPPFVLRLSKDERMVFQRNPFLTSWSAFSERIAQLLHYPLQEIQRGVFHVTHSPEFALLAGWTVVLRNLRNMKNPFEYGGVVSGNAFCNREKEVADLLVVKKQFPII